MKTRPLILSLLFCLTVVVANTLVKEVGPVPVGFGLVAPAGVYVAGLAFILRDLIQRTAQPHPLLWVSGAILAGAAISFGMGQGMIAVAGAVAFAVSEFVDLAVFTVLWKKTQFLVASVVSNVVGAVVDSLVFLSLAFGSLEFLEGQVVGKMWVTAIFVGIYLAVRRVRR